MDNSSDLFLQLHHNGCLVRLNFLNKYCIFCCVFLAQFSFGLSEQELKNSITEIESTAGRYTNLLIDPYLELARIYLGSGRLEEAEKALRQAQHLTHRDDGVYTLSQLQIVDLLTQLDMMQEKIKQAEGQQQFALQINKHNTEENSVELIPAFLKLAVSPLDTC